MGLQTFLSLGFLLFLQQVAGGKRMEQGKHCDVFKGSWIYDETYPLYDSSKCSFIQKQFNCIKNGRRDREYLKYRWKPHECELPKFDGEKFLEKFTGKSIMFVGDSLSLNQWQSLICMLHTALPEATYELTRNSNTSTFTVLEYDVKVMLSRNAFLVDISKEKSGRVLKLNSIESGKLWLEADLLIFDTWHWWLHTGRKQPWKYIQDGNKVYKDMDRSVAYEKALTTWANWVDSSIDETSTRVVFQGVSPDHSNSKDWNNTEAQTCEGEKSPIKGWSYPGGPHPAEEILKRVLNKMSKEVILLDVTLLSQLRVDGHPSVHGYGGHRSLDCTHWCLAGVPDTWNQLLYAIL